jgi:hypothetical protein
VLGYLAGNETFLSINVLVDSQIAQHKLWQPVDNFPGKVIKNLPYRFAQETTFN